MEATLIRWACYDCEDVQIGERSAPYVSWLANQGKYMVINRLSFLRLVMIVGK